MPELPEVEITRRNLERWLGGGTVARAFARPLIGHRVLGIGRRGKWLRIELAAGLLVFSHLGMTGKWVRRRADDPLLRWERARIDVARGARTMSARYVDSRRFGRLLVARKDTAVWRSLGPDPLVDGLDERALAAALGKRKRAVKEALMDQTVLAGIGNILATEALWLARVDPRARTDALSLSQMRALARAIHATIARSLAAGNTEEIEYARDAGGRNPFRVYGRAGQPCARCATALSRIVLAGRGTTYCRTCQKLGTAG